MAWNREEDGSEEREPRNLSHGTNETGTLSEAFSVLSHRNNRRILVHLLQHGEPISVDALATHVTLESTPPAADGTERAGGHNDGGTSS